MSDAETRDESAATSVNALRAKVERLSEQGVTDATCSLADLADVIYAYDRAAASRDTYRAAGRLHARREATAVRQRDEARGALGILALDPRYFVALDGDDNPTVWYGQPDDSAPRPMLSLSDIVVHRGGPPAADVWDVLTSHLPHHEGEGDG